MAMGTSTGGTRQRRRGFMADINVTPMVDVMLVLLVIFMITAPIIKQIEGLQVDVPQLQGDKPETILTEDARTVVISADGTISRGDAKSIEDHYDSTGALIEDLKVYREDATKAGRPPVVVIAGDRAAKWERVMQVWNCVKSAGV